MQEVTEQAGMHPTDLARIEEAVDFVQRNDTSKVLVQLLPGLTGTEQSMIQGACTFKHTALLVFPPAVDDLCQFFRARGMELGETTSSVVVRNRLSLRYRVPAHSLEVNILRVPVPAAEGNSREVEIFALPVPAGSPLEVIASGERERRDEAHLALEVRAADRTVLHALRSMLVDDGRLRPDGGGYNRRERATVLYFRDPDASNPLHRRLELLVDGQHPEILAAHHRQSQQPANRLLELMTGAWRTQAIAVAAELDLADHLAERPGATVEQLAHATGANDDGLGRLLRYLVNLGVVISAGAGFELTEVGQLLRSDAESSMRPLALLYGGPFYESFGHLIHSVRTGQEAFEHLFGSHHFTYFAERPELAELFDQAMASSASVFGGVAELIDFSLGETVVDVAGGNGKLLMRILQAAPNLRGVLLERAHAIEAAQSAMAEAGCADRCQFVTGDFTVEVPAGGDIYILSRVLHDWDDDRCREILGRCAEAIPEHGTLLVVERLLPEDNSPSLAYAWDIHMLCNVGGRERTATHYARLLGDAGFEVTGQYDLPLDVAVISAAKTS